MFLFTIADPAEEAVRAQNDPEFMNRFIERNRRFVMFCAFRTLKHFISESDDEWSVALIAFHEAVLAYDREKGNFKQFAALIIRRRLIDHLNAERRHAAEIPADTFNIGARYYIRELLKPLPETARSLLEAEVPAVKRRTSCVYADLLRLHEAMRVSCRKPGAA